MFVLNIAAAPELGCAISNIASGSLVPIPTLPVDIRCITSDAPWLVSAWEVSALYPNHNELRVLSGWMFQPVFALSCWIKIPPSQLFEFGLTWNEALGLVVPIPTRAVDKNISGIPVPLPYWIPIPPVAPEPSPVIESHWS